MGELLSGKIFGGETSWLPIAGNILVLENLDFNRFLEKFSVSITTKIKYNVFGYGNAKLRLFLKKPQIMSKILQFSSPSYLCGLKSPVNMMKSGFGTMLYAFVSACSTRGWNRFFSPLALGRLWSQTLKPGSRAWPWSLAMEPGSGDWRWSLALGPSPGPDPGVWPLSLILEFGPGAWPWSLALESGHGA